MTAPFAPLVSEQIWNRYPEYRALSIVVQGFRPATEARFSFETPQPPRWLEDHIEAWRSAFRVFGANPKKTPSSVESLWKRVRRDGALPTVEPLVDLYNALSIEFGAPFGGEDADCYAGVPRLDFADGTETFDTAHEGGPVVEHPEKGEVIWRDDLGVTCRRWNWRQCRRTALTGASKNLWFVIDRLPGMPIEDLHRAGEALNLRLRNICPRVDATTTLLEPST